MEIGDWPNLVAMFLRQAERHGQQPFLWEKTNGRYQPLSWREVAAQVAALAASLQSFGLTRGDRVLLLSQNSPRWAIADLAIMAVGGVTVPTYTTNTPDDHAHILSDSGAAMAIVSTAALARPFFQAARKSRSMKRVVAMEDLGDIDVGRIALGTWDEALSAGTAGADAVMAAAAEIDRDALACLIYTSGTGGQPKGVMLSHRAIITNCVGASEVLAELGLEDEVFLSFLPLCHAYEHSAGLMFPISIGAQIYFAERSDALAANLLEARPTIMTAVPRLFEIMRERILRSVSRQRRLGARLLWAAVELGRKRYEGAATMSPWERLADRAVERLVRDKIRARFGGRLKALVSGGAPLNYDVGLFFTALGLRLLQGYGLTEAAPVVAVNLLSRVKLRTVGPPMKHVEVRIADDGEVLVRGPLLMDGYWKQPKYTAEVLRDGWLHTGDIGVLDHDGFLQITDRKKDIIVNSAGETISPQHIEGALALEPEIEVAVAIGDNRPHIGAIIVPDHDFMVEWAKKNATSAELSHLAEDKAFRRAISQAIDRANAKLSVIERVKHFVIADQPFTIENGMMTPTMKPRRVAIVRRWGPAVEQLY
jgi:long-chain acyl-CoA synthetase